MRKIIIFTALIALVFALFSFSVFAAGETGEETSESASEEETVGGSVYQVLIGRLSELTEPDNIVKAVAWLCSVASVLIITLIRNSIIKLKNKISGTLDNTAEKTNELVEAYNENNLKIDRLEALVGEVRAKAGEKNERDESVYQAVRDFSEMFFMIYNNSTTIPEGVKDIVRAKYAASLSADDKKEGGGRV